MIALKIPGQEMKTLMHHLLKEETFDVFEVRDVSIRSFIQFDVHGLLFEEAESDDETAAERRKFALWRDVRPYIFNIIKGAKRPRGMKFVFSLPSNKAKEITPLAAVLFLNLSFDNGELLITSGLTKKEFSLDKSADQLWDEAIRRFFRKNKIAVEEI
jgi:hypothetical protein